jgi:TPP-dependent pyruvate/acetoin dehydrogenase alpha subunit
VQQTESPKAAKGIKREDPPPRPVEQTANRGFLEGHDPSKHYVWVSEVNDPTINVGYYKSRGYKIAQYDPDEARPTLGYDEFKQGDPIKSMGMVLMEAPLEHKQMLDKVGWDRADAIVETIRKREIDPLTDQERAQFKGITSVRTEQDDRRKWQF